MNAFQLLKEDHQKVSGIFQQLEPTTERAEKTRTELFAKLKEELDIHAQVEETIFYPSIKQAAETREIVLEGFEEHHVIKTLLKELEALPVDTEQWTAKLKVLQENISPSSSSTWCSTFSCKTLSLAAHCSVSTGMPSSSVRSILMTWCSSKPSRTISRVSASRLNEG